MGWNDHRDVALDHQLRQLLAEQALEPDSRQEILARYILDHGFAALSEEQQQQFRDDLLPLLNLPCPAYLVYLVYLLHLIGDTAWCPQCAPAPIRSAAPRSQGADR